MERRWQRYANPRFLEGIDSLVPRPGTGAAARRRQRFLSPLTGFKAKAVSGYVPAFMFFDCLRNREFPTTITIRDAGTLDYLPEPDIFHDIAGHVPMHTDRAFADTLVRFGECAHTAAEIVSGIKDEHEQIRRIDQHHQGDGAVLLVHDRVRADAKSRQRTSRSTAAGCSALTARSSTRSTRRRCSAIRCSSSG